MSFKERFELLREGIPNDLVQKGVWVFPEQQSEWPTFRDSLQFLCERDGFELEFVELTGLDYVLKARPQISGLHGVVTSNACRQADFMVDTLDGAELIGWQALVLGRRLEPDRRLTRLRAA